MSMGLRVSTETVTGFFEHPLGSEVKLHGLRTAVWRPGWGLGCMGEETRKLPRRCVAVVRCFGMIFNILILITCSQDISGYMFCLKSRFFFSFFSCYCNFLFFFVCLIPGIPSLIHFDVNVHTNCDVNVELVVWSVCLVACLLSLVGWLVPCRGLVEGRHGHRAGHHRDLATLKKHEKRHCHRWKKIEYYLT